MDNFRNIGKQFGIDSKRGREVSSLTFVRLAQEEAFDDVTIVENADLFIVWDENWTGKAKNIVLDEGKLYRSIHDVLTPAQNTKPSSTPSMWMLIGDPGEEWPEWSQPIGTHDAYSLGSKVTFNGNHYISAMDENIWSPAAYPAGWEIV